METTLVKEIYRRLYVIGFERVEVQHKLFLNEDWYYVKAYHNDKAILFDFSECFYFTYGLSLNLLRKEWKKVWQEKW